MLQALFLLAEVDAPAPAKDAVAPPSGFGALGPLPVFIGIFALFFLLIVRPQQQREKKARETLLTALKKNDEVETTSGIIGIVTSIKEGSDEVTIKSEDTKLRVRKSSISRIVTKPTETSASEPSKS